MPDVICSECARLTNGHWRQEAPRPRLLCAECGAGVVAMPGWRGSWVPAEADRDLSIVPAMPAPAPARQRSPEPAAAAPGADDAITGIIAFAAKRRAELLNYVERAGGLRERAIARKEADLFERIGKIMRVLRSDADLERRVREKLSGMS